MYWRRFKISMFRKLLIALTVALLAAVFVLPGSAWFGPFGGFGCGLSPFGTSFSSGFSSCSSFTTGFSSVNGFATPFGFGGCGIPFGGFGGCGLGGLGGFGGCGLGGFGGFPFGGLGGCI